MQQMLPETRPGLAGAVIVLALSVEGVGSEEVNGALYNYLTL